MPGHGYVPTHLRIAGLGPIKVINHRSPVEVGQTIHVTGRDIFLAIEREMTGSRLYSKSGGTKSGACVSGPPQTVYCLSCFC